VGLVHRGTLVAGLAAALVAVAPAQAGVSSGDDENEYEGRIDGIDGYYFGFDLNDAKTKAKGITARVGYECDNDDLVVTLVEANGQLNVNDAGEFNGKVSYKEGPNSGVEYRVRGSLGNKGKASGTLKGKYEDPFYDTPCRTGRVDWRARRGADVETR
jgi:hypothetical protein